MHGTRNPSHPPSDPAAHARGGRTVHVIIAFTILFVLGMTALIWYRWYPVSLPTSELIIVGDPAVSGVKATVVRRGQQVASIVLDSKSQYSGQIWLVPGSYDLRVTRNGKVIQSGTFSVGSMQRMVDDLHATSQPSSRPAKG